MEASGNATWSCPSGPREAAPRAIALTVAACYALGVAGNAAALVLVRRGARRNRRHVTLLSALAANDLLALLGMSAAMLVARAAPNIVCTRLYCAARVLLRVFGLGSVAIAVCMAIERWLALTKPFLYQKHVSGRAVQRAVAYSWLGAAALTCLPLAGWGRYYVDGACARYREGVAPGERAYALTYVAAAAALCATLVVANLCVAAALCLRRPLRKPTPEERAFSRLMLALSALFIACWMPQVAVNTWAQVSGRVPGKLSHAADLLLLLNYALNPYLYVLLSRPRLFCAARRIAKLLQLQSCRRGSAESTKQQPESWTATVELPEESLVPLHSGDQL